MIKLKRIIEVDTEVAKTIKGGNEAACNCNCYVVCGFESTDARTNRDTSRRITSSNFK